MNGNNNNNNQQGDRGLHTAQVAKLEAETAHLLTLNSKTTLERQEVEKRLTLKWYRGETLAKATVAGLVAAVALYATWKGILQDVVTHAERKANMVSELAEIQQKTAVAKLEALTLEKKAIEAERSVMSREAKKLKADQMEILAQLDDLKKREVEAQQRAESEIARLQQMLAPESAENSNHVRDLELQIQALETVSRESKTASEEIDKRAFDILSNGELRFGGTLSAGADGSDVRRIQEWLALAGYDVPTNGGFDQQTLDAVLEFQLSNDMMPDGFVGPATFALLTLPMRKALTRLPVSGRSFSELMAAYAQQHLEQAPSEVGGPNRGPWVRLYCQGNDGQQWAWTGCFTSFLVSQVSETLGIDPPIDYSPSVDTMAAHARANSIFVSSREAAQDPTSIPVGAIFLRRRTPTDWIHSGVVVSPIRLSVFRAIEGNTNDEGARDGYEVAARTRSIEGGDYDFIVFAN